MKLFGVLLILLSWTFVSSYEDLMIPKADFNEIQFLATEPQIAWTFSNCGSKADPLQMKSVNLSSIPVNSKEFIINLVFNFFLIFIIFYYNIIDGNCHISSGS